MKFTFFSLLLCLNLVPMLAQHTFSIVAIDSVTGQIGSAGATCGDDITWPGTGGAILISDILPGTGAIHTQSFYLEANQLNARTQMETGSDPEAIIDWLTANDIQNNPAARQYGIVGWSGGQIQSAAFTGASCMDEKGHRIGPNYAIQGNILIDGALLDSMEQAFVSTPGQLSEKLMAALQGAKVPGADSRCLFGGISSLSAFLRIAQPDDSEDSLWLDLNIPFTQSGVDPIDELQTAYDAWKLSSTANLAPSTPILIRPQPASHTLIAEFPIHAPLPDRIRLFSQSGALLRDIPSDGQTRIIQLKTSDLPSGIYILTGTSSGRHLFSRQVTITGTH